MTIKPTWMLGGISIALTALLAVLLFGAVARAGNGEGGVAPLQGPVPVENLY